MGAMGANQTIGKAQDKVTAKAIKETQKVIKIFLSAHEQLEHIISDLKTTQDHIIAWLFVS